MVRTARHRPDALVIGVDVAADNLRELSGRAARRPERGGLANVLFGRMALEAAPGELAGLADEVSVLLPWGSLLCAVARPDPERLQALGALGKPHVRFWIVFGYSAEAEGAVVRDLGLPRLDSGSLAALEAAYQRAGLAVRARWLPRKEVGALPTTWARKLAFSDRARIFVEIRGARSEMGETKPGRSQGTSSEDDLDLCVFRS